MPPMLSCKHAKILDAKTERFDGSSTAFRSLRACAAHARCDTICRASRLSVALQEIEMTVTVIVVSAAGAASRSPALASCAESPFLSSKPLIDQRSSMLLDWDH